jgi:CheY-like chemotaxis protein
MRRTLRPLSQRRPDRAQISAEHLASLSHEFRTPLNGVLGMTRLLENTRLTEEQRAYAAALRESGEHLLALVNEVLDFARLGAGKIELRPAMVDVESLLRGVCELLSPRARERGLEIAWAVPASLGAVAADENRLRQILLNFAGNAVKFTPSGGVLLRASAVAAGRVRFSVEDTGPGVADADRKRIFEAFTQTDPSHAALGGAGLGLAIARRLARAMGGDVGVDGSPSGGARFWFEAVLRTTRRRDSGLLAGRTVGVAAASSVVREGARRQIEACGGRAVAAAALAEVHARTQAADVILIDLGLVQKAQSFRPPTDRQAIVLLAPEERDQIPLCRRGGFQGYLIKPLRRASLAERVLIAAGAAVGGPVADDDERIAEAAAPGVRILLVEDNAINALLAKALLTREGCDIEHVMSGEESLAAAQVGSYDLILMDMRMPGLSGVQTAQRMREQGVTTPIVALTANAFDEDRQACTAAGMDDFLVKPLSPDSLRAVLVRWTAGWTQSPDHAKVG